MPYVSWLNVSIIKSSRRNYSTKNEQAVLFRVFSPAGRFGMCVCVLAHVVLCVFMCELLFGLPLVLPKLRLKTLDSILCNEIMALHPLVKSSPIKDFFLGGMKCSVFFFLLVSEKRHLKCLVFTPEIWFYKEIWAMCTLRRSESETGVNHFKCGCECNKFYVNARRHSRL